MARILITTLPMAGHVRPGLPFAAALVAAGHDVTWYSGAEFGALVTGTGARYLPMSPPVDYDGAALAAEFFGARRRSSLGAMRWAVRELFVSRLAGWVADLERHLPQARPDVIVTEAGFVAGTLVAERQGLPHVVLTSTPLSLASADVPPNGFGLGPSASTVGRLRNRTLQGLVRHVAVGDIERSAARTRADLGLPPNPRSVFDWGVDAADRYLVTTVPEFEYPRSDLPATVEFIGAFARTPHPGWQPPPWWPDVTAARAAGRPVVLVTQGTLATDPERLLLPAVEVLNDRDALVLATTVGHDPAEVFPPDTRAANLRVEEYLPFENVLPFADLLVTNGGYGGVQQALANGVPLVVAGTSEDKLEVGRRVEWCGGGVYLATDRPSAAQLAGAIDRVLGEPSYRAAAGRLAASYAAFPGVSRAVEVVADLAGVRQYPSVTLGKPRGAGVAPRG